MATGRTRHRLTAAGDDGEYTFVTPYSSNSTVFRAPINKSTCTDTSGNYSGDNPLWISHDRYMWEPIEGQIVQAPFKYIYKKVPPLGLATPGHLPLPTYSTSAEITRAYARSNPSKPAVDVALMAAEMKDLPGLVEFAGRRMIQRGAHEYLKFQFGWRPLVDDVMTLLDFQKQFSRRLKMLQKAKQQGMLTRNISLQGHQAEKKETEVYFASQGKIMRGFYKTTTTQKRWAVVKWFPTNDFPSTDEEMLQRAKAAVYSLRPDSLTAWNLVPWSWMADWFVTVGDYLQASRNTVGLIPGPACLMENTISARVGTVTYTPPGLSGGGSVCTYETKTRVIEYGPQVTASIPLLSGYQTSILGALGITRVPGHLLGSPNRWLRR